MRYYFQVLSSIILTTFLLTLSPAQASQELPELKEETSNPKNTPSIQKKNEEIDLNFLDISESKETNTIRVSGLQPKSSIVSYTHNKIEVYDAMIEKTRDKVSEIIQTNGGHVWHNYNENLYKKLFFQRCTFDKELLGKLGEKLLPYSRIMHTHFADCHFSKVGLKNSFSKSSTFYQCTGGKNKKKIPDSKKK